MQDRTEALRARYLAAARELFLDRGFEGTTTEEIARRAAGSKATLYKLFPDKDAILIAIIDGIRVETMTRIGDAGQGKDCRAALVEYASGILAACSSPAVVEIHRLVISRVRQQPGLGEGYYARVTKPTYDALAADLARCHERGEIHCPDPARTAERFLGIVGSRILLRVLLEGRYPLGEHEIRSEAEACVDLLLHGLGKP